MTPLSPPPWLYMQQRYGPPPSYPNLRIPGLNAPIPSGCQFGNHAEGWGRPPVDEQGRPIYGDVFGVYTEENASKKVNAEEVPLWGELITQTYNDEEYEEKQQESYQPETMQQEQQGYQEQEYQQEQEMEEEEEEEERVIPGSNIPAAIPLRKDMEVSKEPKSLYTHLEEVEVEGGSGYFATTKRYVMSGSEK